MFVLGIIMSAITFITNILGRQVVTTQCVPTLLLMYSIFAIAVLAIFEPSKQEEGCRLL